MLEDTSPEMRRRYFEHLRRLTPAERGAILDRLTRGARELAEAGIRRRHPRADDAEVRIRLATLLYGREAAARLGPVPADAVDLSRVRGR
jgi:hypothetical protein